MPGHTQSGLGRSKNENINKKKKLSKCFKLIQKREIKAKTKTGIDGDRRTLPDVSTFHLIVIKAMCSAVGDMSHGLVT